MIKDWPGYTPYSFFMFDIVEGIAFFPDLNLL